MPLMCVIWLNRDKDALGIQLFFPLSQSQKLITPQDRQFFMLLVWSEVILAQLLSVYEIK